LINFMVSASPDLGLLLLGGMPDVRLTWLPMWKERLELADRAVTRGPPAYREHDNSTGGEQLWQRDVGNTLPVLAMTWVEEGP
jgi:hypothetical protein